MPTLNAVPVLPLAWLVATALAAPASQAAATQCDRVSIAPMVNIAVGKSTVVRPAVPVTRILLGNPDNAQATRPTADSAKDAGHAIAAATAGGNGRPGAADVDVLLLGPSEIYLLGKSIGSTNIVMLDQQGRCTAFDVVVGMDTSALQALVTQLLPDEKDVRVSAAFDSIVLSGSVSDVEALTRITDLANAFVRGQQGGAAGTSPRVINMLGVAAPQQVMLEVKVAEISKSLLDQFGIDFSRAFALGDGSAVRSLSGLLGGGSLVLGQIGGTGTGVPLSSVGTVVGGTLPSSSGASAGNITTSVDSSGKVTYTTTYGTVPGQGVTNVTMKMQKTDGLVKVLAEPSIMAISGQTGSFLAGGKIFIPVTQTNSNGTASVGLEEREFGVSVKFTPTVLGGGRINLRVRPEVSELNTAGVTISGLNGSSVLPSFTSRKAETTVQLMDGQSFAIGGLIKNNSTSNIKAFPFLSELPLIGALFRSTEFQTDRSELVFVITPRLVKPLPADYALPTDAYVPPTRTDLIVHGRLEGQRPVPDGGLDEDPPAAPARSAPAPAKEPS